VAFFGKEQRMTGYLGPAQSFTHQALLKFQLRSSIREYPSIRSLFVGLRLGEVATIVVPIENSIEGSVTSTMDSLVDEDVWILGETYLPIDLQLYSRANSLNQITHVLSHPQALAQSRQTLERLLGHYIEVPTTSTAEAMHQLQQFPVGYAAVAGGSFAATNNIIAPNIQDRADNQTRFVLIGRTKTLHPNATKTSLICAPQTDRPGLLYDLLHEFAIRKLNLTKIESRNDKTTKNLFLFYLDIEVSATDELFEELFALLEFKQFYPRVLGSYNTK
jgi:prephenate dehydratase